jgi:hypothetical protein
MFLFYFLKFHGFALFHGFERPGQTLIFSMIFSKSQSMKFAESERKTSTGLWLGVRPKLSVELSTICLSLTDSQNY